MNTTDRADKFFSVPTDDSSSGRTMPSLLPAEADTWGLQAPDYQVAFKAGSLFDDVFKAELETILTEGLKGDNIVILEKTGYSFQQDYFIVLQYMRRIVPVIPASSVPSTK